MLGTMCNDSIELFDSGHSGRYLDNRQITVSHSGNSQRPSTHVVLFHRSTLTNEEFGWYTGQIPMGGRQKLE